MPNAKSPKSFVKNITMSDVAELAGVTIGTVSHVINGTAPISEETTAKVDRAIKKLGYKPNLYARSLRKKQSKMIGLLIPDLMNEFYCAISRIFMDFAYNNDYSVMLTSYQDSLEREKREFEMLMERQVDAIVLFGGKNDDKYLQSVSKAGIPIILCDRRSESNQFSTIEFDNEAAMRNVVRILKEKGYTKLGYISELMELTNLVDCFSGFKIGIYEQGLVLSSEYIHMCESLKLDKSKNGYDFMKTLLTQVPKESLPEVFITTSDLLAIGFIGALSEAGYHIPSDFGVVGYDNISIAPYIFPALTTVAQDGWMMAKVLWDTVSDTLNGNVNKPINIKLINEVIVRESC